MIICLANKVLSENFLFENTKTVVLFFEVE